MSAWRCIAGSAFLIPSGSLGNHFHVVLNDPKDFAGYPPRSCVACCICTIRNGPYDKTCIVERGEHKFIVADSYVAYRDARIDIAIHLEKLVAAQVVFPQDSV